VTRLRALAVAALLAAPNPAKARGEDVLRLPIGDPARRDRVVPVVLDAITDAATGVALTPAELPPRLSGTRLLLVGEEHTVMETHRVQLAVLEELARAGRRLTIALEMFPYTEQKPLDDWSAGRLSEEEFLATARWYKHWGYPWPYYRDIFLFARDRRIPMIAVNAPRDVVSAVRKKGFQGLTAEEAAHIPSRIDTESPEHLRLFQASFEDASFHAGMDEAAWKAMLAAQCTWDATMGFNAVKPLSRDADPKAIVVVLVGAGHVQYGLGIERQVRSQAPIAVASLIPVAVRDEQGKAVESVQASYASFVWGVAAEPDPIYPDLGVSTRPREGEPLLEVIHVEKDSPAARAGLKVGDVLVSLDGAPVPDNETLERMMAGKRWGDAAHFVVRRDGAAAPVVVPLRRTGRCGAS
jgi:uncharacterized iron-regulated protein